MLNDLVPPLFALVVGTVPRLGLGSFLTKDPGPQGRWGEFVEIGQGDNRYGVLEKL